MISLMSFYKNETGNNDVSEDSLHFDWIYFVSVTKGLEQTPLVWTNDGYDYINGQFEGEKIKNKKSLHHI